MKIVEKSIKKDQDERYEDYDESVNFSLFSHSDARYFEEVFKEKNGVRP